MAGDSDPHGGEKVAHMVGESSPHGGKVSRRAGDSNPQGGKKRTHLVEESTWWESCPRGGRQRPAWLGENSPQDGRKRTHTGKLPVGQVNVGPHGWRKLPAWQESGGPQGERKWPTWQNINKWGTLLQPHEFLRVNVRS